MCIADLQWHDDAPVVASPRQILRRQLDRLAERGWTAFAATELEFIVFRDTYEQAFAQGATRTSSRPTSTTSTTRCSAPSRRRAADRPHPARDGARRAAGRELQGRVQLRPARDQLHATRTRCTPPTRTSIYKNGAKEIAAQEGMAITFMAKYDEREGNSCHIHLSVRGEDGTPVFAEQPELFDRFLAGQLACLRELTLFMAPERQLLQALRRGLVRPDRGRLGPRQPHLLDARDRRGPVAAGREPASRAATSTPTWRSRR